MGSLHPVLVRLDAFQQRHRGLAFPLAVVRRFSEDQAGSLAAVIAYYAFFSLFPLLLLLATVLGLVLHGNPHLQQRVLGSALKDFPVIGPQLRSNVHSLNRTGAGLIAGLAGTLLGARGVASAAQNAINTVWGVAPERRPGFAAKLARSAALVLVVGGGILVTTTLSTLISGLHPGGSPLGFGVQVGGYAVGTVLNVAVFMGGFRLATAAEVATRDLVTGAVIAAVAWEALQGFGTYVIAHELRHASELYGTFGLVLGLLWWLHLQAQITLYAVEIDVVRARRLWPRSLLAPAKVPQPAKGERARPPVRLD
ncbi:MAG: YihY/virulence factor BrkB family protein [Mycobacteriales bacterium]